MTTDHRALAGLTAVVQSMRPEWTESGIRNALLKMLEDRPLDVVVDVALRGAKDTAIRTPGALPLAGPHWSATAAPTDPGGLVSPKGEVLCLHPIGQCQHGERHGHCALCRYPDGMPDQRRLSGPGAQTIVNAQSALRAKAWQESQAEQPQGLDDDPEAFDEQLAS